MRTAFALSIYLTMIVLVALPTAVGGFRPRADGKVEPSRLRDAAIQLRTILTGRGE